MAQVTGPNNTVLTDATAVADYLFDLSPWGKTPQLKKAFTNAAYYMLGHDGKGGGTKFLVDGKVIYHATENRGEATVFFTSKDGVVTIVGIAEHSGKNSATATYTLVWKTMGWNPTKLVNNKPSPTNQISL